MPSSRLASAIRTSVVLVVAAALTPAIAGTAHADTAPPAGTPATVSADALPNWQVNGVVWRQAISGTTVFAGGSFTRARPPGVNAGGAGEVAANNLFAYNITTGNRVTSFNHSANGQVISVEASPDRSTIYVGGDFTSIDGKTRQHIAAFDASTGALLENFKPNLNGSVRAISISGDGNTVYAGGMFTSAGGNARNKLAKFAAGTGALDPLWTPSADDGRVQALVVSPAGDKVVVGGRFSTMNGGVSARGTGAVSTAGTGVILPWLANQKIIAGRDSQCGTTSLSTDGTNVYGSQFSFGCGNFEGVWAADPTTGALVFANDCHGDTYDTFPIDGVVYSVSHAHDCQWMGGYKEGIPSGSNMRRTLAFTTAPSGPTSFNGGFNTGPDSYGWDYRTVRHSELLHWFPDLQSGNITGQGQAAWTVTANSDYVVLGGEFPAVNGKKQQGLTRFGKQGVSGNPNARGPVRSASAPNPTAAAQGSASIKVTWQSAYDQDNENLAYDIYRSGTAQPVGTINADSNYYTLPNQSFTDQGVPGGTYTYTVKARDPSGNTISFPATNSVTVAGNGNQSPTASFTSSQPDPNALTVDFDGSGSSDPAPGSVVRYDWNYGDGTIEADAGATPSHTYGAAGPYNVTLTVTDNQGAKNSQTKSVSVSGVNQKPTANFSYTASGLKASFNGASSSDPDNGDTLSYAWDFGDPNDATVGTGVSPTHTYDTAGDYNVTLTVTDNHGSDSDPVTKPVTVTDPGPGGAVLLAQDDFGRTATNGWGNADTGQAWTVASAGTNGSSFNVGSGTGNVTLPTVGATRAVTLGSLSTSDSDVQLTVSPKQAATGDGTFATVVPRVVGNNSYRSQLIFLPNGTVTLNILRLVGGTTTTLVKSKTIAGVTWAPGDTLNVRVQAVGTTPTTVQARVWKDGQTEPSDWPVTITDSTSGLQSAGTVALYSYLGSKATASPVALAYDNLRVYDPTP
jgi:PKD repeat protein